MRSTESPQIERLLQINKEMSNWIWFQFPHHILKPTDAAADAVCLHQNLMKMLMIKRLNFNQILRIFD